MNVKQRVLSNLRVGHSGTDKQNYINKEMRSILPLLSELQTFESDSNLNIKNNRAGGVYEPKSLVLFPLNDLIIVDIDNINGLPIGDNDKQILVDVLQPNAFQFTNKGVHLVYFKQQDYRSSTGLTTYLNDTEYITYDIKNGTLQGDTSTSFHWYGLTWLNTDKAQYIERMGVFEPIPLVKRVAKKYKLNVDPNSIDWFEYYILCNDINVMGGLTPWAWFQDIPSDGRYKFLSLYIARLKERDLLSHELQQQGFIKLLNEFNDLQSKARLIELVKE